jgi:hypothetical protein
MRDKNQFRLKLPCPAHQAVEAGKFKCRDRLIDATPKCIDVPAAVMTSFRSVLAGDRVPHGFKSNHYVLGERIGKPWAYNKSSHAWNLRDLRFDTVLRNVIALSP